MHRTDHSFLDQREGCTSIFKDLQRASPIFKIVDLISQLIYAKLFDVILTSQALIFRGEIKVNMNIFYTLCVKCPFPFLIPK